MFQKIIIEREKNTKHDGLVVRHISTKVGIEKGRMEKAMISPNNISVLTCMTIL